MEQERAFPDPEILPALDALGLEFLADFLEVETDRNPGNLAALAELGHLCTRIGRYEKGLAVDRRLVELHPEDPTAHYNLACSLALVGDADAAVQELERAVALGYDDLEHLLADEDLRSVREHPRFRALAKGFESKPDSRPQSSTGTPESSPEAPA